MRTRGVPVGFAVFLLALGTRLGWIVFASASRGAAPIFDDEHVHWQMARNLLADGDFATDDGRHAARMPVYPLLLALTAWAGPVGMTLARLGQALVGAATAWAVYKLGANAVRQRVGALAGGLVALDPYAIFFSHLLLTEVTFTFFAVLLTASAWRALRKDREASFEGMIGVAVCGGLAVMTRPSALPWVVLLWGTLWMLDHDRRRAARRTGVYAVVLALLLLPWGVRNKLVIGEFAWLSANGGVTLYDAQGPQARGDSDQAFLQEFADDPAFAALGEAERDRFLRNRALEQMWADPGRALGLAWTKFLRTWSLTPNVAEYRGGIFSAASVAFMLPVLIAAAVGFWRAWRSGLPSRVRRRMQRLALLCLLPVATFTAVHCVYVGSLRYRVPLMPFVAICAGLALTPPGQAPKLRR